jgi:hypothetical protein
MVQIMNASGQDYTYPVLDYYARPMAKKQSSSATLDISNISGRPFPVTSPAASSGAAYQGVAAWTGDLSKYLMDKNFKHSWDFLNVNSPSTSRMMQGLLSHGIDPNMVAQVFSGATKMLPLVGNILSVYETVVGKDWITGETLSGSERLLAAVGSVPGANVLRAFGRTSQIADARLFMFAEKSENYRDFAGWALSDSAYEAAKKQAPGNPVVGAYQTALAFNNDTKQWLADNLVMHRASFMWNDTTRGLLDRIAKGGGHDRPV